MIYSKSGPILFSYVVIARVESDVLNLQKYVANDPGI